MVIFHSHVSLPEGNCLLSGGDFFTAVTNETNSWRKRPHVGNPEIIRSSGEIAKNVGQIKNDLTWRRTYGNWMEIIACQKNQRSEI